MSSSKDQKDRKKQGDKRSLGDKIYESVFSIAFWGTIIKFFWDVNRGYGQYQKPKKPDPWY